MKPKILIVGGVAGGATAMARLRRLSEEAEIIVFEKGEYISFANCGLPYYIGQIIKDRQQLFVTKKEDVKKRQNIDVRTSHEVLSIDREQKTVEVKNHETQETYHESYDKLLLATGSYPIVPPFEGVDNDNVFTLTTIADTDAIYNYIKEHNPKRVVVVGGGFIGLEMVENFAHRDLEVSLVELADQVMAPLDKEMAAQVEKHLKEQKVQLYLGQGLKKITDNGKLVHLESGKTIETDLILLSIGVKPQNKLAEKAGLELNQRGGVIVNEYLQTSDPDIYAVGDVIEVEDYVTKQPTMVPLAGPANKQGRMVAGNILDIHPTKYRGTQGTSIAKIFDLTVATTGINEKQLARLEKQLNKEYKVAMVTEHNHARYYPGATPMTIKLIFDLDGKVLGAQIVGQDGVDKRIDVLASVIHFKGTIYDLMQLELAYAPPYGSAKDPVNMVGYVAENILNLNTKNVLPQEFDANSEQYTLLDIREDAECKVDPYPYSCKHIPLSELRDRLGELDKDQTYLVFCAIGARGYFAQRILMQNDFEVANLLGGYQFLKGLGIIE